MNIFFYLLLSIEDEALLSYFSVFSKRRIFYCTSRPTSHTHFRIPISVAKASNFNTFPWEGGKSSLTTVFQNLVRRELASEWEVTKS